MTYFDWKYYKELLIRNKKFEKVQGEFTVVVIKFKISKHRIWDFDTLCLS